MCVNVRPLKMGVKRVTVRVDFHYLSRISSVKRFFSFILTAPKSHRMACAMRPAAQ
jgi:hypothetical protein